MSLQKFEKIHRQSVKHDLPKTNGKEVFITWFICFIAAPFLFTALFVIPIIGQMLFAAALILTLIYVYVRKSLMIALAVFLANLMFIIPTMITMQLVANKNRFEVTMFFLIASCIPVSIFYIFAVAGKVWYLIEKSHEAEPLEGHVTSGVMNN